MLSYPRAGGGGGKVRGGRGVLFTSAIFSRERDTCEEGLKRKGRGRVAFIMCCPERKRKGDMSFLREYERGKEGKRDAGQHRGGGKSLLLL